MGPTQHVKDVFSGSRCALLTTLSVAVLGLLGVAVATTAGATPPAQAEHDITVLLGSDFLHKIDQEPEGSQPHDLSAGDTLLHHDPVLDPDSGERSVPP